MTVKIDGVQETLAAFRRLPKDANDAIRERSMELATVLAGRVATAARSDSPQSALMAATVKPRRDRVPVIVAGGTSRVGRESVPSYAVLFSSEFGANRRTGWYGKDRYAGSTGRQYRPHVARGGSYWMFKTVEAEQSTIAAAWLKAADDIARAFGSG